MSRDFYINGETMVSVKGRSDSAIGSIQQLGLCADQIRVVPQWRHLEIEVNAWAGVPEAQFMMAYADIAMNLVHFDPIILETCIQESMGGAPAIGAMAHAGARLGNGQPRFAPGILTGNHLIGLNLSSPVAGLPWRFFYTFLSSPPVDWPLGAERSVVHLNWRAIPYTTDPWGVTTIINGVPVGGPGQGSYGSPLWDNTLDT